MKKKTNIDKRMCDFKRETGFFYYKKLQIAVREYESYRVNILTFFQQQFGDFCEEL